MEVAEIILEDSSSYTPESVAALKEALEEAREVLMSATDQGLSLIHISLFESLNTKNRKG